MLINCSVQPTYYQKRDFVNNSYFNDIRQFPILDKNEERRLLKITKTSSSAEEKLMARQKLIESNLRFVVSVARKFGKAENMLDLINEGNLGLIKAIENFDLKNKCRLITYAVSWIVVYIQEYQTKTEPMVAAPNALKLQACIKNVKKKFFFENERDATPDEIAELVSKSYKFKLTAADDALTNYFLSIEESAMSQNEEIEGADCYFSEYVDKTKSNNIQDGIDETYKERQTKFFLGILDDREKNVVTRYFGIECTPRTFEDISEELDMTKERTRQVYHAAIKKMRKFKEKSNNLK